MTAFDERVHELYGTAPEAFTAARDEGVMQARAAGDKALARDLAKLRRPTQSAWLVNQLARDDEAPLDVLLSLVDEFTTALTERDGARLAELTARRRQVENQLVARAGEIGAEAGAPPSDGTLQEVRGILDAAVSDPDIADAVRTGRLVKPAAPTWGEAPTATPVARARTAAVPTKAGKKAAGTTHSPKAPSAGKVPSQAAEEAANAAAAEAELATQVAREQAAVELAERTVDAERANAEYERLSERLEELRAEARDVAQQVTTARQAAVRAERRRAQAERRHHKLG